MKAHDLKSIRVAAVSSGQEPPGVLLYVELSDGFAEGELSPQDARALAEQILAAADSADQS